MRNSYITENFRPDTALGYQVLVTAHARRCFDASRLGVWIARMMKHFLFLYPAHGASRREMIRAGGRSAKEKIKPLSDPLANFCDTSSNSLALATFSICVWQNWQTLRSNLHILHIAVPNSLNLPWIAGHFFIRFEVRSTLSCCCCHTLKPIDGRSERRDK